MGVIFEISALSHRDQLCSGIGRLLDSEGMGSDFEFFCADSTPIKADFIILQIFCRALQNSNCRRIRFEDTEITKQDVRCLLEFVYRGVTRVDLARLNAVKRTAAKLGLEVFLDLVDGIPIASVEEEEEKNETDTENEAEMCESLEEDEDEVEEKKDSNSVDYTECSQDEEPKSNVSKDEENGDIGNHSASENRDLVTKLTMGSNGQYVLEKIMKCDQCDYSCATETLLKTHIINAHCETVEDELKLRKRSITSNASDHACETCGKYFQSAKNLRAHKMMAMNHSEKVDCQMCGKHLSLNSMYRHRKMHEIGEPTCIKKFKCSICDLRCRDRFNLKVHLKNIHKLSDRKIAGLLYSEATLVSDEDQPKDNSQF